MYDFCPKQFQQQNVYCDDGTATTQYSTAKERTDVPCIVVVHVYNIQAHRLHNPNYNRS
jgi:hypothetical protein